MKERKRRAVRRLEVKTNKLNIWDALGETQVNVSFKDWLAIDKQAAKDLCDGVRFIHGRKPRNATTSPPISTQVNAVRVVASDVEEDEEVMEEKEEGWEEEWDGDGEESDSESYLFDSEFEDEDNDGYQSDTSITHYPYNPESMGAARPFAVEVRINGVKVEAIADTGASVSVISKPLAKRLNLPINKNLMSIQQLDERDTKPNGICVNVPVRIGGKLRREHCSVLDRESDLLLLRLPWMRAYGVKIDPTTLTLSIPSQESKKDVVVQGYTRCKSMEPEAAEDESTSLQVFMLQMVQQETSQNARSELIGGPSVASNGDIRVDWYDAGASEGGMSQEGENGGKEKSEKEKSEKKERGEKEELPEGVRNLLSKYQDCFVEHAGLGRVNLLSHEIKTTTETPIKSKPYRLTWTEEAQLRKELDHLLELGLIKPSKGEWTSPVLFVGKNDGSLRLCIDYRRLNKLTVKDHFPLPFIDELIDSMGGARYFSTLDAASGYWQVPIHENSIHKTGFVTKYSIFDWCVLPFGLTSAPATFQRLMTQLLQPLLGKCVHVFIDDIIIYSRTLEEHVQHLEQVFNICKDANLRMKLAKCTFASDNVEYLGHQITKDGLKPTGRNVKKVLDMTAPRNKSEVRSFLGLVGYYRRFIPAFADKSHAIQQLTRSKMEFVWGEEQEAAFKVLKEALVNPPVLAYPDPSKVQILTTDVSGKGIGAILSQSADGSSEGEQVIAYASRALRGPEVRYATTHVEALAIVAGIYQFRHYLRGRKFVLYTDHSALTYILNNPSPSPKVSRWSAATMEYDFITKHRKGESHPEQSSRRFVSIGGHTIDIQVSQQVNTRLLLKLIMDYAHYLALYYYITEGTYPRDMNDSKLKRRIRNKAAKYLPFRGKLYLKKKEGDFGQEVLHSGNVMEVIKKVHREGHLGINNTWRRMGLQYEGYQLYERVREYVESCEQCQLRARRRHVRHEESHPIPTPSRPFFMIGCDAVGPINPPSKNGNRYLLVAVDYLTRWPVVAAVPNISEKTTASFLFNCVVKDFGVPTYILTDRGANFKSDYVHNFLKWMGCKPLTTTAFRPQVNGLCERMNQTVVEVLSNVCQDQGMLQCWDECLASDVLAVRSTPNDATGFSPAMLLYGYDIRTPATWPEPRKDYVEGRLADEITSRIKVIDNIMQQHRELARQRTQQKQQQRKQRYDQHVVHKRFQVGDQVLMLDKYKPHKLANRWSGPMIVTRVNRHSTYWLQGSGGKRLDGAVNGDMLKPWKSKDTLIPDVVAQRADRQLQAYIERIQPG